MYLSVTRMIATASSGAVVVVATAAAMAAVPAIAFANTD